MITKIIKQCMYQIKQSIKQCINVYIFKNSKTQKFIFIKLKTSQFFLAFYVLAFNAWRSETFGIRQFLKHSRIRPTNCKYAKSI